MCFYFGKDQSPLYQSLYSFYITYIYVICDVLDQYDKSKAEMLSKFTDRNYQEISYVQKKVDSKRREVYLQVEQFSKSKPHLIYCISFPNFKNIKDLISTWPWLPWETDSLIKKAVNLSRQRNEPLWKRQVMTNCSQDRKWPGNDPGNTNI